MRLDFETSQAEETDLTIALTSSHSTFDYERKFREGVKAVRAGSRDEARRLLLEAAEADSNSEDVWLRLASVSEYPEELLIFLNNALLINPANEHARQWAQATETMMNKSFDAARAGARGMSDDYANAEKSARWRQVLSFNSENQVKTNSVARVQNPAIEKMLEKACAQAFAADYDAAENTLDQILTIAPEMENAWLVRAFMCASFDEKAECWETVLHLNPENELARANIDFLRLLKSKSGATEAATQPDAPLASAEETDFFAGLDSAENSLDLENLYADFTSAAGEENSDFESFAADEGETYEISVGEADSNDFYSIEEISSELNLTAAENDYSLRTAKKDEPETEVSIENQTLEEVNLFDDGETDGDNFSGAETVEIKSEPAETSSEMTETVSCPFCSRENEPQAFVCPTCSAVLTLSDLEMLLAHADADREIVRQAVERIEAEKNFADFGTDELKILGIGQINLKNIRQGFLYLREAAQLNPNDVVLSSQVNALAIRLSEIESQASIHSTMPKNKTILVVDDSETVRKLISGKLEKSGHAVLCAVDGMDALEKIEAHVPDLILLDITMPRMDGYQVCKMIRTNEKTKDIPIVMISGKDGFFDKVRGRMAGTTGYITKPFGPETLMKTVESYIV